MYNISPAKSFFNKSHTEKRGEKPLPDMSQANYKKNEKLLTWKTRRKVYFTILNGFHQV